MNDGLFRRARPWLGTMVEIALPVNDNAVFETAFARIATIHELMSFHSEASDLARMRKARPGEALPIAAETYFVLQTAMMLHARTAGLFDIAIGRKLVDHGFLPKGATGEPADYAGTTSDLRLDKPGHVRQTQLGLYDLGGIAKGFAVDQAVEALIGAGVSHGIVNAGGDMRIFGAIAQPVALRMGNGQLRDLGLMMDCAIASSQNSQSRTRLRGQICTPHIGPDGRMVQIDGLVSVAANSCMIADAMTKVAMIVAALANRILADFAGWVVCAELGGEMGAKIIEGAH